MEENENIKSDIFNVTKETVTVKKSSRDLQKI